ncbi:hypothetical protein ACVWW6_008922 [Bradyrhizobium sp. USDA 3311]|uniref:hypothetical protein n=1 Tax=unclassified Bradyrhizobium TaxID=2631580 RepID=UPI0013745F4E|nr:MULTISPECIES: hypothetical protein [unclassified Bradyrhizobium]MDA9504840.1 hypothetical protein [Bradyrhizobium sp. CCBAU 11386]QHP68030.1 hypothetical protein EI171_12475 [Bradyrhizobium sp. LCT2]
MLVFAALRAVGPRLAFLRYRRQQLLTGNDVKGENMESDMSAYGVNELTLEEACAASGGHDVMPPHCHPILGKRSDCNIPVCPELNN